jgi:hypothetical protein
MWGQDETDIQPSVRQRGVEDVTWFGINGPEVWVGPMRESFSFSSSSTSSDSNEVKVWKMRRMRG